MSTAWDAVKPFIGKFAPMLGAAVGGPLGAAAGAVIQAALGTKDADPASIKAAIANGTLTGEQILALRQADDAFALKMKELDINSVKDMESLAASDRASARNMQIQTRSWIAPALACGITLGFFGLLWFLLRREIPQGSKDVLNVMLGSLGSAWLSVVAYYFGTTAGSAAKTEMIYKSTPTKE